MRISDWSSDVCSSDLKAPPDGYKVAVTAVELTFLRHLGLTKHTHKELTPVARLNADPAVFVVRADSPYRTLQDLLDAARKDPGNLRVGTAGHGPRSAERRLGQEWVWTGRYGWSPDH